MPSDVAETFALVQNYPNPFNPATTISVTLEDDALVTLKVYDVLGREVATLLQNEPMATGEETIEFNATELTSGVYFYRLEAQSVTTGVTTTLTKKMMLVK